MSLIIRDTISLTTASGVSKIQLCIGDITKLPKQEEADVLVVSAFPGVQSTQYTVGNKSANIHATHCNIHSIMELLTSVWSNLVTFEKL